MKDEETFTSHILRKGMETALIQTEEGKIEFVLYVLSLMGIKELNNESLKDILTNNQLMEFRETYLPYLIHPLCKMTNYSYSIIILLFYFTNMDFLEYADECNQYFSNICDKEFVKNHIEILRKIEKRNIPDYFYDIAEYLNSEDMLEFEDDYEEDDEDDLINGLYQMQNNFRNFLLKDKPHIKEYRKARKIHGEIMDSMIRYFESSKYKEKTEKQYMEIIKQNNNNINQFDTFFDTTTQLGVQALANVVIYKNIENMECITEQFIKSNRFKKKEKEEFLKSMLDSKAGLYEIIKTDFDEAQVYLKNVLNGEIIKLTDIGMSGNKNNTEHYFYTRIISYNDINFGTGLSIIFDKKDKFIQKWIKENKKDYNKKQEIIRFLELYNKYRDDENKIVSHMNRF